jgi:amidophosphoribosyltransferase
MVGKINNLEELEKRTLKMGQRFAELSEKGVNQTELVSILICEGKSFEEGIDNLFRHIRGSCSLLMLTEKGIYAVRDQYGRTPVVIGQKESGYAVATESISFPNLGYEFLRQLGPGEVVLITGDGIEVKRPASDRMQICAFLWVYYGYPASVYEKINVDTCRYRCGAALARRDHVEADCVSGIPDSGVGHAIGYSHERGIPYTRPFVKYSPTWPRSFMPQNQEVRDHIARMKLIVNREQIQDKRIIFCEDSIVRGTQLKDNTQKLFKEGAREVHLRIACPTLLFPCEFLNFSISRSRLDLAGRIAIQELRGNDDEDIEKFMDEGSDEYQSMVEQIKKRLMLTSLMYQRMDDMVASIGLPKEKLCTHCWDGSSHS